MTTFVLYGGKGGVGKTTCAAATGLGLAGRGERTLVVSTDPAHSLGDAFETELDGEPTRIEPNLWAVEADPEQGQETYERIVRALAAEFREAGIDLSDEDIDRLFAAGFVPGSDEVASLEFMLEYDDEQWDRLVFDTAPTGHTLRLLTLPDVLGESLSTAVKLRGEVRQLVTTARSMVFGPAAFWGQGEADDELTAFRQDIQQVASRLRDPDHTEFRVVVLPESLAIAETDRLVDQLRSFDVPVETLVVNRVIDSPGNCDRCGDRYRTQRTHLDTIHETFPELQRQELPDLGPDAAGRSGLDELADRLVTV